MTFSARCRSGLRPSTARSLRTRLDRQGKGAQVPGQRASDAGGETCIGRLGVEVSREAAIGGQLPADRDAMVGAVQAVEGDGQRDSGREQSAKDEQKPEPDPGPTHQRDGHDA